MIKTISRWTISFENWVGNLFGWKSIECPKCHKGLDFFDFPWLNSDMSVTHVECMHAHKER